MENISAVTSFILMAYAELKDHRYLYFICFLFLYIVILLFNSLLFLVIYTERGLHEPMYLFICNLSVNGVYGSTVLLPSMLGRLLSQNYEISVNHCLLQTYGLHLYAIVEFNILAVMAYDRYAAICHPLHYHLLMSHRKAFTAIALSWIVSCLYFALFFMTAVQLSFCDRIIEKMYCSYVTLQTQSCYVSSIDYFFGLASLLVCPGLPFVLILYSYVQILRICLFASKESQLKALHTCMPHIVTVIILGLGSFLEVTHNSLEASHVPTKARIFMSLYFLIIPPMCNPVVYGMSIQVIRVNIFKLFIHTKKYIHGSIQKIMI